MYRSVTQIANNHQRGEAMKPSDFCSHPFNSILNKWEPERIARNIMIILKRTGNTFRELSWEEYRKERSKDGGFGYNEKRHFDTVNIFCKNQDTAKTFCAHWAEKHNDQSD